MTGQNFQRCTRCVMDTSDRGIRFDKDGVCNHCRHFEEVTSRYVFTDEAERQRALESAVARIRAVGRGRAYDCLVGLSGGVDSSYLAYQAVRLGLRPLAVHVDGGWNSELAVNNIENIVKRLGIDLITFVVDWEEMQDLQLAFFKASVANCEIPQDHAFVAAVYRTAAEKGIRFVLSGVNYATEGTVGVDWGGYSFYDLTHLEAIQRRFGTLPLKRYPKISIFQRLVYYPQIRRIKTIALLNHLAYNKAEAKRLLEKELGWRDYGGKHYESVLSKFLQQYFFVHKCGFDKRIVHLSDLIHSGQMTRDEALQELSEPLYDAREIVADKEYIAKKLGVSPAEFDEIVNRPLVSHLDYPNNISILNLLMKLSSKLR